MIYDDYRLKKKTKTKNKSLSMIKLTSQISTCSIFIKTTASLVWSVPTNFACVTASAMFSTVVTIDLHFGSKYKLKI